MDDKNQQHCFSPERFLQTFRQLLPELNPRQVEMLTDGLSELEIDIIRPPATGLIMINGRDCFDVIFHLGEVLVTTAEVEVQGVKGQAVLMGDQPAKVLLAASINAVLNGRVDQRLSRVVSMVETLDREFADKRRQERRLVASTKVEFESMAEEDE